MARDLQTVKTRVLTAAQYDHLSDVPPEIEWLANITNNKTRRAYKIDVGEFSAFTGLTESSQLRTVTRAHVIAWRKDIESRKLSAASIRRKLSALSSLFDYLYEHNAVAGNPVDGTHTVGQMSSDVQTSENPSGSMPCRIKQLRMRCSFGQDICGGHLWTSGDIRVEIDALH